MILFGVAAVGATACTMCIALATMRLTDSHHRLRLDRLSDHNYHVAKWIMCDPSCLRTATCISMHVASAVSANDRTCLLLCRTLVPVITYCFHACVLEYHVPLPCWHGTLPPVHP